MSLYKPVTHVIFDLDGTLLDTEAVYTTLYQSVVEKYGKKLTSSLRSQCFGKHLEYIFPLLIKELKLPISVEEFFDIERKVFPELLKEGCKLKPGVERLVKHLHKHSIPLAVATNATKEQYDLETKDHQDLMSYFHHSVLAPSESEVKRIKPAPDVFLVCARRFDDNPPPEKILVVEDSPTGFEAGLAAGMQVVAVPDPSLDKNLCKNATIVLDSLEAFQPELFGLPPFPKNQ